jgi:hypothetical protein
MREKNAGKTETDAPAGATNTSLRWFRKAPASDMQAFAIDCVGNINPIVGLL